LDEDGAVSVPEILLWQVVSVAELLLFCGSWHRGLWHVGRKLMRSWHSVACVDDATTGGLGSDSRQNIVGTLRVLLRGDENRGRIGFIQMARGAKRRGVGMTT
jgi:hypothetical protein